jgi:hypothetical protein
MKNCKTCNQIKPLTEFYKNRSDCKACISQQYHAAKGTLKGHRTYEPKPLPKERTCRVCNNTLPISEFYVSKPASGRKSPKIETVCKPCTRLHYQANRETILARARAKAPPHKPKPPVMTQEQTRARVAAYKKRKRAEDPLFRLRSNVGTAIANALSAQGHVKRKSTVEIIGCSFAQLRSHLESQFPPGMTWHNRSLWHIDHIIPVAFAQSESELLQLNHYSNLRPIWRMDNLTKSDSITACAIHHPIYKTIMENRIPG